uniref:Vimentin-related 2 n=1 Tax=Astyanax mexicanus TaxID=7994 RepID=A0A3B1JM99_ASTMX
MAMLRVSSYRRLFEEQQWGQAAGGSQRCGAHLLKSSAGGVLMADCPEPDFPAAHALNRAGVVRFTQERSIMAALNDRLAVLIDVARCLEEENESLELQIIELEERLGVKPSSSTSLSIASPSDYSVEAVIERLRREKEDILCETEALKTELQSLQMKYDEVVEQRTLVQLEREDVAVEVDADTADCLALRDQVGIYEEQLAEMERQHELRVESLTEPETGDEGAAPPVALQFPQIDITPAIMDIKEYYCQLAESLQFESRARAVGAITAGGDEQQNRLEKLTGGKVKDPSEVTDVNVLKDLVAELQKEVAELEKYGEDLEAEIEAKREAHLLKIEELEVRTLIITLISSIPVSLTGSSCSRSAHSVCLDPHQPAGGRRGPAGADKGADRRLRGAAQPEDDSGYRNRCL